MFEARLPDGNIFKNVVEAIKDLLQDTNIDCTEEDLSIQAMDSAHVSLVAVNLNTAAFEHYRCDRTMSLGMNTSNVSKIFKMMGKSDSLVLKAEDNADNLTIMFESDAANTIADFGMYSIVSLSVYLFVYIVYISHTHTHPLLYSLIIFITLQNLN